MFCVQCGVEISEDAIYCSKCGAKVIMDESDNRLPETSVSPEQEPSANTLAETCAKRLKCPNCNSTDLVPVTHMETETSGGRYKVEKGCCGAILLGPLGLLCGLCGTQVKSSSKSRTDWVCKSCGNVFRNLKEIETEEYEENMANALNLLVGSLILYVAGNLFLDNGVRFLGISGSAYVGLGVLGATFGLLELLVFGAERKIKSLDEIKDEMEDKEDAEIIGHFISGIKRRACCALCVTGAVLIDGIIFAIEEIRFFLVAVLVLYCTRDAGNHCCCRCAFDC